MFFFKSSVSGWESNEDLVQLYCFQGKYYRNEFQQLLLYALYTDPNGERNIFDEYIYNLNKPIYQVQTNAELTSFINWYCTPHDKNESSKRYLSHIDLNF